MDKFRYIFWFKTSVQSRYHDHPKRSIIKIFFPQKRIVFIPVLRGHEKYICIFLGSRKIERSIFAVEFPSYLKKGVVDSLDWI